MQRPNKAKEKQELNWYQRPLIHLKVIGGGGEEEEEEEEEKQKKNEEEKEVEEESRDE